MKTLIYSLLLSVALAGTAGAQELAGTWQGKLAIEPGKTMLIHFVIKAKPGGGYDAVVTSPEDGAIKNVPAASVKFADGKLAIDVPALSGGYAGTMRNGALEGEWSQAGAKLPLTLRPFAAATLTKADIDALRGEWVGTLTGKAGTLHIVMHFSSSTEGTLKSTFDVPEQGVSGWEVRDVALDDGEFSAAFPQAQARITGTLKGDQVTGEWNQLGMKLPITLKKGHYVAVATYLDLPAAAWDQLKGNWTGTLNGLAVRVRYETDAQGRKVGFFDSLQQNLLNLSVNETSLVGTKFTFGLAMGAKYSGELAGTKLTGEWTQPGLPKALPLVLTREK
jgi:hypothetical protein